MGIRQDLRDFWDGFVEGWHGSGQRIRHLEVDLHAARATIKELRGYVDKATEAVGQFQRRVLAQEREIERLRLIVDTLPYSPFKRDPRDKLLTEEDERILRGESGHDGEQAPGSGGSPDGG